MSPWIPGCRSSAGAVVGGTVGGAVEGGSVGGAAVVVGETVVVGCDSPDTQPESIMDASISIANSMFFRIGAAYLRSLAILSAALAPSPTAVEICLYGSVVASPTAKTSCFDVI